MASRKTERAVNVVARTYLLASLRAVLGILAFAAIGRQLLVHIEFGFSLANFFSYFTNLSNLFAAAVFLYGARNLLAGRHTSAFEEQLRTASVVNLSVVGVVFAILLREAPLGQLLPWVNFVLHTFMPLAALLDWIIQPPRTELVRRQLLLCQIFPMLYLGYILIRGANTGWYPYPFLNPAVVGSYGVVSCYAFGIAVAFVLAGVTLIKLGNTLRERANSQKPSDNSYQDNQL